MLMPRCCRTCVDLPCLMLRHGPCDESCQEPRLAYPRLRRRPPRLAWTPSDGRSNRHAIDGVEAECSRKVTEFVAGNFSDLHWRLETLFFYVLNGGQRLPLEQLYQHHQGTNSELQMIWFQIV